MTKSKGSAIHEVTRFCSLFLSLSVFFYQVLPAQNAFASLPESAVPTPLSQLEIQVSEVDVEENESQELSSSHDDLFSQSSLNQTDEAEAERGQDEYEFDEALDLLRADYASAVIVKSITAEDLKKLVHHDVEVGLAIISEKIVLFTSGSNAEIRMNPVADGLLNSKENDLIVHAHLEGSVAEPSTNDIAQAARSGRTEYLISTDGVYAYDGDGKINEKAYDYGYLAREIQKYHNPSASTVATRGILNEFIAAIDDYNENQDDAIVRFSEPVTILPGGPGLASFDVRAGISITRMPDNTGTDPRVSIARVGYSTSNHPQGSFGGLVVNFGSSGQNLSSINTFSFDLRNGNTSPNHVTSSNCPNASLANCIKIEFKSTNNQTAIVYAAGVSNSFQQYDFSAASLQAANPFFDINNVKEIVFVIEHFRVANQSNGFLDVKLGGIEPQILKPDGALGVGDVTPLPATSSGAALIPVGLTSTSSVEVLSKSELKVTYSGGAPPNDFGGTFASYDDGSTPNTIEVGDLTAANFPNGLVVGLKFSNNDFNHVKFEATLADGQTKNIMLLGNVPSGSNYAYYRIPPAMLGLVSIVSFVIEGTGNTELDIQLGTFNGVNTVNPTVNDLSLITKIPPYPTSGLRPGIATFATENANAATMEVIQASETFTTFVYDGTTNESLGGFIINMDDPSTNDNNPNTTTDEETRNWDDIANANGEIIIFFETLSNSTVPPVDAAISNFLFEVQTLRANGTIAKDQVSLNNLTTNGQGYVLKKSDFFGLDFTKVVAFAGVFTGAAKQGIRMDWGTFDFTSEIPPTLSNTNLITKLAPHPSGIRPILSTFAGETANVDEAIVDVLQPDESFATIGYNGLVAPDPDNNIPGSIGGFIVSLDDPATNDNNANTFTDVETRTWTSLTNANEELVIFFNSVVSTKPESIDEFLFEVQSMDTQGNVSRDQVLIKNLERFGQGYVIKKSDLFGIDFNRISAFAGVFTGLGRKTLIINWGDFDLTKEIGPTVTDTNLITKLAPHPSGIRPSVGFFAGETANVDLATVAVDQVDEEFTRVSYNGLVAPDPDNGIPGSIGGFIVSLDDPATNDNNANTFTDVETRTWTSLTNANDELVIFFETVSGAGAIGEFLFEVQSMDTQGNVSREQVLLTGLVDNGQGYVIKRSDLFGIDFNRISAFAGVFTGVGAQVVEFRWGDFDLTKEIGPTVTDTNLITKLAPHPSGIRPSVGFFAGETANVDLATVAVDQVDEEFTRVSYNGLVAPDPDNGIPGSIGGFIVSLDDPATNDNNANTFTDVETRTWTSLTNANDELVIFFETVSGAGAIGEFLFEVQSMDTQGNVSREQVLLTGLVDNGQGYVIKRSDLFGIDFNRISAFAGVFTGVGAQVVEFRWGDFDLTKEIGPTVTDTNLITKLAPHPSGIRPSVGFFAGETANVDLATVAVDQVDEEFTRVSYNGLVAPDPDNGIPGSIGGFIVSLDDPATNDNNANTFTDVETRTWTSLTNANDELVIFFETVSGAGAIGEFLFEVQSMDTQGNVSREQVLLTGLVDNGQGYVIKRSDLFGIDFNRISAFAGVFTGVGAQVVEFRWGDFDLTKEIGPTVTDTNLITKLAPHPSGIRPSVGFFAGETANVDLATVAVDQVDEEFTRVSYNGLVAPDPDNGIPGSIGGFIVSLDDPATNDNNANTFTDVETRTWTSLTNANDELVIFFETVSGAGAIGEFLFEVQSMDTQGNVSREQVLLTGLVDNGQGYVIKRSDLFGIDFNRISAFAGVFTGVGAQVVEFRWGDFDLTKEIGPTVTDTNLITKLAPHPSGIRPSVGFFAGETANVDLATVAVDQVDEEFTRVSYNGLVAPDPDNGIPGSIGGFIVSLDDPATNDNNANTFTDVETRTWTSLTNANDELVIFFETVSGAGAIGEFLFEVQSMDTQGNVSREQVLLTGLVDNGQGYVIKRSDLFGIDFNRISAFAGVFTGVGAQVVEFRWGDFDLTKEIGPTVTDTNLITKLAPHPSGIRPSVGFFAGETANVDLATVAVDQVDEEFTRVSYNGLVAPDPDNGIPGSIGGFIVSLDDPATNDNNANTFTDVETRTWTSLTNANDELVIFFETVSGAGAIGEFLFEVQSMDTQGNVSREQVLLTGLVDNGQGYVIKRSDLFGIDFNRISAFAGVFTGVGAQVVEFRWGDFDLTKEIGPTVTDTNLITKLAPHPSGIRPSVGFFAGETANVDLATVAVDQVDEEFTRVSYNGLVAPDPDNGIPGSIGGFIVSLDDPATNDNNANTFTDVETRTWTSLTNANDELVIFFETVSGAGAIGEFLFEVQSMDTQGNVSREQVLLTGLVDNGQGYVIKRSDLFGIDFNRISAFAGVFTGVGAQVVEFRWGDFDLTKEIGPTVTDTNLITKLAPHPSGIRPSVGFFAGETANVDLATVAVDQVDEEFTRVSYNGLVAPDPDNGIPGSIGGFIVSLDDPATNDNNANTFTDVETRTWTSLTNANDELVIFFETVSGAGAIGEFLFEVQSMDTQGNVSREQVLLTGLVDNGQGYVIKRSDLFGIDFNRISAFAGVFTGVGAQVVEFRWGDFDLTKEIGPTVTDTNLITKLAPHPSGIRPSVGFFAGETANVDLATVAVDQVDEEFTRVSYNGLVAPDPDNGIPGSIGGFIVSLDDPATNDNNANTFTDVETRTWTSLTNANDELVIFFETVSGAGAIGEFLFEVQSMDTQGNVSREQVLLTGLVDNGQGYVIKRSDLFGIDFNRISAFAGVFTGVGAQVVEFRWGDFDLTKEIGPTVTDTNLITKLAPHPSGIRPSVGFFAGETANVDLATVAVDQVDEEFTRVSYNGLVAPDPDNGIPGSIGGFIVSLDDPATNDNNANTFTDVETRTWTSLTNANDELVIFFETVSGAGAIGEFLFEVQSMDTQGNVSREQVLLTGLVDNGQGYVIKRSDLFGIDFNRISAFAGVFTGVGAQVVEFRWGDFDLTKEIGPTVTDTNLITKLAPHPSGIRPSVGFFAGETANVDLATVAVDQVDEEFTRVSYNGLVAPDPDNGIPGSIGGFIVSLDDPATNDNNANTFTDVETRTWTSLTNANDELVIFFETVSGAGAIGEFLFEVQSMDTQGNVSREQVLLTGLVDNGQGYVIKRSDLFGIDFNRISAFAGVFTGVGAQVVEFRWGDFDLTKEIGPTVTDTNLITKLAPHPSGIRPSVGFFAGETANVDLATVAVDQVDEEFTRVSYNGLVAPDPDNGIPGSIGGFIVSLDDPATNDNNANTFTDVETRTWTSLTNANDELVIFFETVSGAGAIGEFLFEVQSMDTQGNVSREQVLLTGLVDNGQGYVIKRSDLFGIDFNRISAFAGVFTGVGAQVVEFRWGDFDLTKEIGPTVTDTNLITKLAPHPSGIRPSVGFFAGETANVDLATVAVDQVDEEFTRVSYNGLVAPDPDNGIPGSIGGFIVSLDDPATNDNNANTFTDVETRTWTSLTNANDELVIFFETVSGAGAIGEFLFEVQSMDTQGNVSREQVLLTGLVDNGQGYVIKRSDLFGIDFNRISAFAGVFTGVGAQVVEFRWGDFDLTKEIGPTVTDTNLITKLAPHPSGIRPSVGFFAGETANVDLATVAVDQVDEEFTRVSYNGLVAPDPDNGIPGSIGGFIVSLDDPATNDNNANTFTDVETRTWTSLTNANDELVIFFETVSGAGAIGEFLFEVQSMDTQGNVSREQVLLTGLVDNGQGYVIKRSDLFGIDFNRISAFAGVFTGVGAQVVEFRWGDFDLTKEINPTGGLTPADVTKIDPHPSGQRVPLGTFAGETPNVNLATMTVNQASETFATLTYNGTVNPDPDNNIPGSIGGFIVNLDDPATNDNDAATFTDVETRTWASIANANDEIIIFFESLGNGVPGNITDFLFEVQSMDVNGVVTRDQVKINGLTQNGQAYVLNRSDFVGVDFDRISAFAGVFTGANEQTIKMDWGTFSTIIDIAPDATNQAITPVPTNSLDNRPTLTPFASNIFPNGNKDFSKTTLDVTGVNEASVRFQLFGDTSFGGVFVDYDDPETDDNDATTFTDVEGINFNNEFPASGLVLSLRNPNGGISDLLFEVTDITGKRDLVKLSGITNAFQTWTIDAAKLDEIDILNIKTMTLLLNNDGVNGLLHLDNQLDIRWGDWATAFDINPDGTNQAITPLPETSTGALVTPESFASEDFSKANLTVTSQNELSVNFQLWNTTSFGGVSLVYDNGSTNDNDPNTTTDIETIDMDQRYPNGFTLEMNNGGSTITDVVVELTDIDGKRDRVVLNGITNAAKTWTVALSQFDEIDTTMIQSIVLLKEGRLVDQSLNVKWGPWVQNDTVTPDATNQAITPLPEFNANELVTPSAFETQGRANMTVTSPTELSFNFQLWNTTSFAGVALVYDNASTNDKDPSTTTDIETVNLDQRYPNGLTFQMDNGGSTVTDIVLELTDIDGKRDRVILDGITNTAKTWTILTNQFQEVDTTMIQSIVLLKEGRVIDQTLNVKWGDWTFVPTVNGATYDPNSLTTLNNAPGLFAGGSTNQTTGALTGFANIDQINGSKFEYDYVLTSEDSFVFAVVTAGGFDNNNDFQGDRLSLPENLVVAARAATGTKIRVEVKDDQRRSAKFDLVIDKPILQNFTLQLSGNNIPTGFDRNNIAEIIFVNDRSNSPSNGADLVQVEVKGLGFSTTALPQEFLNTKAELLDKGTDYFQDSTGVDPVTGFPYDRSNGDGTFSDSQKFTQPTLIGFLGEMYGQAVSGQLNLNLMTADEALNKANALMDSLLNVQAAHGWNGLLPWLDLDPVVDPSDEIGLGDNANLALSLATMVGSIEQATSLTIAQQAIANQIATKVEQFLDNQEEGYKAFVHPTAGIFQAALKPSTNPENCINTNSCVFTGFVDRLNTEFRAGFVFLVTRFPNSVPKTVVTSLLRIDRTFTDERGGTYKNIISFEGGAFQTTWNLRGNERDFNGFRNVQLNNLSAQLAFARDNNLPGILSASDVPNQDYFGLIGLPDVAETSTPLYFGAGSTYALASAYSTDPFSVLHWLTKIRQQLPDIMGPYGLYDSATSNSEIAQRYFGIDIATTILGLSDAGPAALVNYLRNRNLELAYNTLYEEITPTNIFKTASSGARPPEFPDRSLSVFNVFSSEGVINDMPIETTQFTGVRFAYANLASGFAGRIWDLPNTYDAAANKVNVFYSVTIPPDMIKVEFKDAGDNTVFTHTFAPVASARYEKMSIDLPNNIAALGAIQKVVVIAEDNDAGDFFIHSVDLKHLPSSQRLAPNANLTAGDVTALPGSPVAQFFGNGSLSNPAANVARVNFDVTGGGFAGVSYNFDPTNTGAVVDLSSTDIRFGLSSDKAIQAKIEVDDMAGNRAIVFATSISTTEQYYEFLKTLVQSGVELTQVKKINFVVDESSVAPGDEVGTMDVLLGGATF